MTAEQKRLQRLHILATLAAFGPLTGLEIVKHANEEVIDDRFEALPDLTNRGIGSKMGGAWHAGFVTGDWTGPGGATTWSITFRGRDHLRESGVEF